MRTTAASVVLALVVVSTILLIADTAQPLPRYSARVQQVCGLCHFNPAGGGARTPYATQVLVPEEMSVIHLGEDFMEEIDPQVSKSITVGADLRTFFFSQSASLSPGVTQLYPQPFAENFFKMQGNLYVNLQLTPRLSAHLTQAISETREVYGLAYLLPASGYVKVGRFVPTFGWRFDDHSAFNRAKTGFFPPGYTDVGVEVGVFPGPLEVQAGITNGMLGTGSINDQNDDVAYYGRGLLSLHGKALGAAIGGSVWHNPSESAFLNAPILGANFGAASVLERTAGGPFGYISWKNLTWLGELDFSRLRATVAGADSVRNGWITSHELTWNFARGFDLRGNLDYMDLDSDADGRWQMRYGVGLEVMPYPFLKTSAGVEFFRTEDLVERETSPGSGVFAIVPVKDEFTQILFQVLFFY